VRAEGIDSDTIVSFKFIVPPTSIVPFFHIMIAKIVILVVASLILAVSGTSVEPAILNKVDMKNGVFDVNEKDSYMESQDLTAMSSSSSTARLGHSLLGMDDGMRSLQIKVYSSCGALAEPTDNWVNGICVGLEASDCCKLSPGGKVVYAVTCLFLVAVILGIVACSCACCRCCPWYSKMCCAPKDQPTNTPVVAATPSGNAYDGGHTEAMNAKEDTPL
jgi:hypothetical protein